LLFGLGVYLVLTAQPIGRPRPDLRERLRRLDVDERVRDQIQRRDGRPIFASRVLESLLRPVLDDAGRWLQSALARFGLAGSAGVEGLEGKLRLVRPGVEPTQFFGEKIVAGLVGLAAFPAMTLLNVHPFGPWPVWSGAAAFVVGFLAPDWQLEHRLAARRTAVVMALPAILDMLTIAASAGLALEQALELVARQSGGAVPQELRRVSRDVALGQRTLAEALGDMAARNGIPELTSAVSQLQAAHEHGIPLVQTLSAQADALREQKRLRIVEAGGRATVKMLLPVALFILPVLFVVLLVPAAIQMMNLTG
jgi:tight adherence protein C